MPERLCKCGKSLKVDVRLQGRLVKCPVCNSPLRVPEEQELLDEVKAAVGVHGEEAAGEKVGHTPATQTKPLGNGEYVQLEAADLLSREIDVA